MPWRYFLPLAALAAFVALPAMAGSIFSPEEVNVLFGAGKSQPNWHGSWSFESLHVEMLARSAKVESKLGSNAEIVTSLGYSSIRQPRSYFGPSLGGPDDHVRAAALYIAVRKNFRSTRTVGFFTELGTGPMWSSRRVPASTSRLNFQSQLGVGAVLRTGRAPLYFVYHFSHISNGGLQPRNPGLEVHSLAVGTRAIRLGR